jgi:hypothetical protein
MWGSTTIRSRLGGVVVCGLVLTSCGGQGHVSPITPPPYRAQIPASYDVTWRALIRSLASENLSLRVIARDSGVIATDEVVTPIGLYADCGRFDDQRMEGEALVSFTLFAQPNGPHTEVQINSKMKTRAHRSGSSGALASTPVYQCASTGRFEANLLDAVRAAAKP